VTRLGVGVIAVLMVGGCVPSHSTMFGPVDRDLERRLGLDVAWQTDVDPRVPEAVAALLDEPLDADAALRIAIAQQPRSCGPRYDGARRRGCRARRRRPCWTPTDVDIRSQGRDLRRRQRDRDRGRAERARAPADRAAPRRSPASELAAVTGARGGGDRGPRDAHVETAFYDVVAATAGARAAPDRVRRGERRRRADRADARGRQHDRPRSSLAIAISASRRGSSSRALEVAVTRGARGSTRRSVSTARTRVWTVAPRLPELPRDRRRRWMSSSRTPSHQSLDLVALRADAETAAGHGRPTRGCERWLPGDRRRRRGRRGAMAVSGRSVRSSRISLPIFDQQQGPRAQGERGAAAHAAPGITATAVDLRAAGRGHARCGPRGARRGRHIKDVILPLRNEILDRAGAPVQRDERQHVRAAEAKRDLVDAGSQYIDALRRYWKATGESATALHAASCPEEAP
jgi:hypothetical protein